MIRRRSRRAFQRALRALPLRSRDILLGHLLLAASPSRKFRSGIPTLPGLLRHLRQCGLAPAAIVDVGACHGDWSMQAAAVFPDARLVMIDGDPQHAGRLRETERRLGARYVPAVLGPEPRPAATFYQHDGGGSSVLEELTSAVPRVLTLPMVRLDDAVRDCGVAAPVLLKLDVQGFELEVLRGAPVTLEASEVVILETSLLPYNQGAPLIADVIAFMRNAGFAVYDFCGQTRRETDDTLFQTDVAFVRENSPLRAPRAFRLEVSP